MKIRDLLDTARHDSGDLDNDLDDHCHATLDKLAPAIPTEVKKMVMNSETTSCRLDPIPTSFFKILIDILLPILTHIINM